MKNVIGPPAENEDFFDRPNELRKLRRELSDGSHILLAAPRRVGKTSLVLRLATLCRNDGWAVAYFNVEDCDNELSFAEKLVENLHSEGLNPDALARASAILGNFRRALGGIRVGMGVEVEIGDAEDPEHATLGKLVESILRKIHSDGKKVLIIIDEMPELLLAMARQDGGTDRVAKTLHWLRSLRQTHRGHIHWLFLGSVGLDNFVDERQLGRTINDLNPVGLEALSHNEADAFLEQLSQDNGLPVPPDMRAEVIARLGWALPHHLQLVFHALRDLETAVIDLDAVNTAFESLLHPSKRIHFATWQQRLTEQLNGNDASAAKDILDTICRAPEGASRGTILDTLMFTRPMADVAVIEDQLSRLLLLLQRDGYLVESKGKYAFRSFLLREYWYRTEVL